MTTKILSEKSYLIVKLNRIVWISALVFFIGNCTFIALTTFSVIERQSVVRTIRSLSSEISAYELQYLQKEKQFSMELVESYGFVEPEKVAFSQKASWFAFYNR